MPGKPLKMYDITFRSQVDFEITEAYIYYNEQQAGLGERFLEELGSCFETIRMYREHFKFLKIPLREFVAPGSPL